MATFGELVRLYHPDDVPEGLDRDGVALEVDCNYLGRVDDVLAGITDEKKDEVVTGQFRRCCAELFFIIDEERKAQGLPVWTKNHRIIFVCEMYRTAKLYHGKTRKDGTSVFYSHLIGTVKNIIRDIGLTGIVSLLAMLKHDMVEDFVDKGELDRAAEEEALMRVRGMAVLIKERADQMSMEGQDKDSFDLMICEICGDFADAVKKVLSGKDVVRWAEGEQGRRDRAAVDSKIINAIMATASRHAKVVRLGDQQPEPGGDGHKELILEDREYKACYKQAKGRFESYIASVQQAASGRARNRREEELYEALLDIPMYRDKIEGYDDLLAEIMREEVRELVNGLTKLRKRDRAKTLEATVAHHLSKVRTYPIAALLKTGGDRTHNTSTIEGHKPDKAKSIMEETEAAYVPEADVFKIRRALRRLVYDCVKFFNPSLLRRYDKTLQARLKSRLKRQFKDTILGCFASLEAYRESGDGLLDPVLDRIADVRFVPRGIDYYTRRAPKKSFDDLALDDLAIDNFDPMFEILVTTKVDPAKTEEVGRLEADIKKLRDSRAKILRKASGISSKRRGEPLGDVQGSIDERLATTGGFGESGCTLNYLQLQQLAGDIKVAVDKKLARLNRIRMVSMREVMAYIIDKFSGSVEGASTSGYDVELSAALRGQNDPNKIFGIILTIFNDAFGGQLHFRINDAHAEARSKRGIIAETGSIPDDLSQMIGSALDRTVSRMQGVRGLAALKAEVFAPRITVKTLSGEAIEFPIGATGFDFAARIHGDILIGAQKIFEKDSVSSRIPAREVRFWDELKPGKVYFVEACKPGSKKVQAGLKWLLFTQSGGGNELRRHFKRRLNFTERLKMARAYVSELSQIYNVDRLYIEDILIKSHGRKFIIDDDRSKVADTASAATRRMKSDYPEVSVDAPPAAVERMKAEFREKVLYGPIVDGDGFKKSDVVTVRRRIWERILNDIGKGDINPILALSQNCETNMRDWRGTLHDKAKIVAKRTRKTLHDTAPDKIDPVLSARLVRRLIDIEKDCGKWEVDVEMPESTGTLSDFAAEFSKEAGINIYKIKEHTVGELPGGKKKGKPGVLKLVFDLQASNVSQYEFFRKLLKLSFRYKIRVIDRMQSKYDRREISGMLEEVVPVSSKRGDPQLSLFDYARRGRGGAGNGGGKRD